MRRRPRRRPRTGRAGSAARSPPRCPTGRSPGAARSAAARPRASAAQRSRTARSTPPWWSWVTSSTAGRRSATASPARRVQRAAGRGERVARLPVRDQRGVAGMQPLQHVEVAGEQGGPRVAERPPAEMRHEHPRHRDMPPAEMPRAEAEVVLLAVALREGIGAEAARSRRGIRGGYTCRSRPRSGCRSRCRDAPIAPARANAAGSSGGGAGLCGSG